MEIRRNRIVTTLVTTSVLGTGLATGLIVYGRWQIAVAIYAATLALVAALIKYNSRPG
jgi:hypothetical protein